MKMFIVSFMMLFVVGVLAENAAVQPPPAAVIAPIALSSATPILPAPVEEKIQLPEMWQIVLTSVKSMPVVGPYVVTGLQWVGIFAAILTALCAFAMAILKSLTSVLSAAQMQELSAKVDSLQNSKLMYWLKKLSLFNADKKVA